MPRRSLEELLKFTSAKAEEFRRNPTKAEAVVRKQLVEFGFEFQSPNAWNTKNGGVGIAIFDFYHPEAQLVVEIDDPSHKRRVGKDRRRDTRFGVEGLRTIRFSNARALRDTAMVIEEIKQEMER